MNRTTNKGESPRARAIRVIRGWVQEGKLRPGDILPTELALCEQLDMARGTIRAALQELTRNGVLSARKGCRRTIAEPAYPVSSTMRRTVVLLSGLREEPREWQGRPGKLHAIEGSALMSLQREGFHGLTVHPERLAPDELVNLCHDSPAGVLIPDPFAVRDGAVSMAEAFRSNGVPVVLNADGPRLAGFDRVISDQALGARLLVRRLLARGCRRILRVWTADPSLYWLDARNRGFEETMREAGIGPLPPVTVRGIPDNSAGDRTVFETRSRLYAGYLIEPLLRSQPPPDVLMLTSDDEVAPVASACRLLGVDPARPPLITGYDNMYRQLPERAFEPLMPIFTLDKCNVRIGASMVSLLQQRIAGTLPPDPQLVILEPLLVVPAAAGA